jgi:uncharacterized protein YecT (DUF1311 family)
MRRLFLAIGILALIPEPVLSDRLESCLEASFRATACIGLVARRCRAENASAGVDCLKQEADAWDDLLNHLWLPLKAQSEARGADAATSLLSAQRQWIQYRDAECSGFAAQGATADSKASNSEACRLNITALRVVDFRAWLRLPVAPPDREPTAATAALLHCLRYAYNADDCHDHFFSAPNYMGSWAGRVRLAEAKRAAWDAVLDTVMAHLLERAAALQEHDTLASLELLVRHADPDPLVGLYTITLREAVEAEQGRWLDAREDRCSALRAMLIERYGIEDVERTIGMTAEETRPECLASMTAARVTDAIRQLDAINRSLAFSYEHP